MDSGRSYPCKIGHITLWHLLLPETLLGKPPLGKVWSITGSRSIYADFTAFCGLLTNSIPYDGIVLERDYGYFAQMLVAQLERKIP